MKLIEYKPEDKDPIDNQAPAGLTEAGALFLLLVILEVAREYNKKASNQE